MSDIPSIGDMTPDDATDPDEPDPEALARRFLQDERDLSGDTTRPLFDDLHPFAKALLLFAFARLIARIKREWRPT